MHVYLRRYLVYNKYILTIKLSNKNPILVRNLSNLCSFPTKEGKNQAKFTGTYRLTTAEYPGAKSSFTGCKNTLAYLQESVTYCYKTSKVLLWHTYKTMCELLLCNKKSKNIQRTLQISLKL